ncbi:MAG: hypothetical protein A2283_24195 [Lentisphaerae bacterium RIFOXYA12_FULL_48_11]|nr:MAG: hypothetical protein A2283_24195 [Lentisphaerae bacterium RIFOXYA12_FULL_48_11]
MFPFFSCRTVILTRSSAAGHENRVQKLVGWFFPVSFFESVLLFLVIDEKEEPLEMKVNVTIGDMKVAL